MAKKRKITRYVPKPQPVYSAEEAQELEKKLRGEIDTWAVLQTPKETETSRDPLWVHGKAPGIKSAKGKAVGDIIIDALLYPPERPQGKKGV